MRDAAGAGRVDGAFVYLICLTSVSGKASIPIGGRREGVPYLEAMLILNTWIRYQYEDIYSIENLLER